MDLGRCAIRVQRRVRRHTSAKESRQLKETITVKVKPGHIWPRLLCPSNFSAKVTPYCRVGGRWMLWRVVLEWSTANHYVEKCVSEIRTPPRSFHIEINCVKLQIAYWMYAVRSPHFAAASKSSSCAATSMTSCGSVAGGHQLISASVWYSSTLLYGGQKCDKNW